MKMLLDDTWVERQHAEEIRDPYDGSVVDTVPLATREDVSRAVDAARAGFEAQKQLSAYERATILRDTANQVQSAAEEFAHLVASEGSKTIREARKEVSRCINTLNVAADESKRSAGSTINFDSFPGGENRKGWYERVPAGLITAITPFNDPLNLVAHKLGPAVAAGNAVLLKPSMDTPLSALKLVATLQAAGLPPRVVQALTGNPDDLGEQLLTDPRIRMISFTGGVATGEHISRTAGIKKLSLELGANSPVLVMNDADLDAAAASCVSGAFWAAGQNCLGVQRIYVQRDCYAAFRKRFVDLAAGLRLGPKLSEQTDMGPLIDTAAADRIERWLHEAQQQGASILTGGTRQGNVIAPTVLENVSTDSPLHREEVFGPTVNLYPIDDLEHGIREANSLPYGIHAAIFTRDANTAFHAAAELECGGVIINDSTDYRLDAMPFGGVKRSGIGREGVRYAIEEMTELKVVCWTFPERA